MFSVYIMSEDFKNATTTIHFKFGFEEFFLERNYREAVRQRVPKAPFTKCFLSTRKQKAGVLGFSNSSGLKSVFEKLRFRYGFAWTVDQTVEIQNNVFKFLPCGLNAALAYVICLP